ncbi:hypothetical protein Cantr_03749 [Candida viswanathii]|uniref:Ada DNA repair metal-binding domain-containing protein n=1 Tax=Candida viswanathii TaxID=5486 RepID=A0A367XM67_9ASCO|nr:hypothetical protein Cantr_03749 [Candida viswanathii]
MVYSSETSKWKAYQFNDPFAAGSFFVCNKISQIFCRPDCDTRPITNLKLEIKFVKTSSDALKLGYKPCEHCDPINTSMAIDVNLLIKCVSTVNDRIGFIPPLLDENEESNSLKIKENILESKKLNQQEILNKFEAHSHEHRGSVPVISTYNKTPKDLSLSKNDSDHYRLVDLACRHLALAAAINVFQPKPIITDEPQQPSSPGAGGKRRRRRRGGVLGFKELAAKSKLSAWHFHRVFKSVTGLTPKTYGDKCWEFVKKVKESGEYTSFEEYSMNSPAASSSDNTTPNSPQLLPLGKSSAVSNASSSPQDDGTTTASYPITPPSQTFTAAGSNLNSAISEFPQFGFPSSTSTSSADQYFSFTTAPPTLDPSSKTFSYQDLSRLQGKHDSTTSLFNNANNLLQYTQFQQPPVHYQHQQPQPQQQVYDSIPSSTTGSVSESYGNMFDELSHVDTTTTSTNPLDYNANTFDDLYSLNTFDESLFNNDTLFQVGAGTGTTSNNSSNNNEENKNSYSLMTTIGL